MRDKTTTTKHPAVMLLHSSSFRRHSSPDSIGCMSGIFRLFSKHHHSNRLKLITVSGLNEDRRSAAQIECNGIVFVDRRISTDSSPRSPTLPEEIRRISPSSVAAAAAEKRKLLLGALAKCDEDLRELKRIIEELKSDSFPVGRDIDDDEDVVEAVIKKNELLVSDLSCEEEQPSPVSVLDELTRSPTFGKGTCLQYGNFQHQIITKRRGDEFLGSNHLKGIQRDAAQHGDNLGDSSLWCRRAMVETVEKACSEMDWGEKRERERIGMSLQDQIYRDLINEMINEVTEISKVKCAKQLKPYYIKGKLHGRGCRRRLSY